MATLKHRRKSRKNGLKKISKRHFTIFRNKRSKVKYGGEELTKDELEELIKKKLFKEEEENYLINQILTGLKQTNLKLTKEEEKEIEKYIDDRLVQLRNTYYR
jgi:hypothetical protein